MTTQSTRITVRTALYALPTALALIVGLGMAQTPSSRSFTTLHAPTSGTVWIVTTSKGSVLQLRNLKTEVGPGLKVWLYAAKAPVAGTPDTTIGAGKYLELGELKSFKGNFSFKLPAGTNVADYQSVVLWCDLVNTAFASASLK